jgi:DNA-binding protein H-NS
MFKLDLLDALSDKELDQLEAYSQALKKKRDEERKSKAMEEARAILAAAGISLKDLNGKGKGRAGKAKSYHTGHIYQHPTNKELVWNGKGQKPKWLRELEAEGERPVEVTQ